MKNKIVSLIPCRGNSKSIPLKNIYPINNHPLVKYSIDASLNCKEINETWVSTDNELIKQVCIKFGSKVIDRPKEISDDNSPTEDVILHFCNNVDFDVIILIQATSPMIITEDLEKGISLFNTKEFDSIFSVYDVGDMLLWNENKVPINYDYRNRLNRQTRKNNKIYVETGSFYIFNKRGFLENKNRIYGKIGFIEIPFWRSFEVDYMEDINNIEKLLKN